MTSLDRRHKNISDYGNSFDEPNPYYITTHQSRTISSRAHQKLNNKILQHQSSQKVSASRSNKAKSEMNYSKSGNSVYTMSIKHRIEKACATNSNSDLKKQVMLLNRQIQKLEKEILRKDQQILEMRNQVLPSKQVKAELFQLYRALNYFEGKIKEMEYQVYKFRDLILKAPDQGVTVQNLNILFEDLRKENEELAAQFEQSEYMRASMQQKYNRLKNKYLLSQRQLSEYKRREISPLYQYYMSKQPSSNNKFNRIMNQFMGKNAPTSMQLKQKQLINKSLQQKLQDNERQNQLLHSEINKVVQQLSKVKGENQMLKTEIQEKDLHITDLFKNFMSVKKSLKKIESQKLIGDRISHEQFYTPFFKEHYQPMSSKIL